MIRYHFLDLPLMLRLNQLQHVFLIQYVRQANMTSVR